MSYRLAADYGEEWNPALGDVVENDPQYCFENVLLVDLYCLRWVKYMFVGFRINSTQRLPRKRTNLEKRRLLAPSYFAKVVRLQLVLNKYLHMLDTSHSRGWG